RATLDVAIELWENYSLKGPDESIPTAMTMISTSGPVSLKHYQAGMLLSGTGDALAFQWEFVLSGTAIHKLEMIHQLNMWQKHMNNSSLLSYRKGRGGASAGSLLPLYGGKETRIIYNFWCGSVNTRQQKDTGYLMM
ncbi:hypothetical protein P4O66_011285, partial [Electrophorus voltai]